MVEKERTIRWVKGSFMSLEPHLCITKKSNNYKRLGLVSSPRLALSSWDQLILLFVFLSSFDYICGILYQAKSVYLFRNKSFIRKKLMS